LFNHSASPQTFTVTVSGGGIDWQKEYYLASMQTKAINIRDLIAEQATDDKGSTLPKNLTSGETGWLVADAAKGSGRLMQSDRSTGMARNFSCGYSGLLCGATVSLYFTTFPDGAVQEFAAITGITCTSGTPNACSGQHTGTANFTTSWVSLSPSIASISGSSTSPPVSLQAVSGGTSQVNGHISSSYCQSGGGGTATVQIPTADPIISTASQGAISCTINGTAGAGWNRDVNKHIVDQETPPQVIAVAGQTLTETYTIGTPNGLSMSSIATGTGKTNAAGVVGDDYYVCSTLCPGAGSTNATQHPTDTLPSGKMYALTNNSVVYKCSSITVNGN
jgi:hypothetical protein